VAVVGGLVGKGMHQGLAVAMRALGSSTRGMKSGAALARSAASIALPALLAALGAFSSSPLAAQKALAGIDAPLAAQLAASPLAAAAAAALIGAALATLWSAGARGWFAPLRHGSEPQRAHGVMLAP